VKGALVPVLIAFADPANPGTARVVTPDDAEAVLGKGIGLQGISAEVVPNGYWPLDFGGCAGASRDARNPGEIAVAERAAIRRATALRVPVCPGSRESTQARAAFTRKNRQGSSRGVPVGY
jgi:hypothetical protein